MRHLSRRFAIALVLSLPSVVAHAADASGTGLATAAYDASAPYRAVHVDTLDPKLQHVFEDARRQWLGVLAAHHTSDGRGWFLQRDGHTLITLHSFASFTEYDALRAFRAGVAARIGPEGEKAGDAYDRGDVAITQPHNSEVWSRNEDYDYEAPGAHLNEYSAGYLRMDVAQVRSDDYKAAWRAIRDALTKAAYPVGRIGFFSMIGSGRQIGLWVAADRAAYERAGSPEDAVARVLGKDAARVLFARLEAGSSDREESEVVPRPELKSPE